MNLEYYRRLIFREKTIIWYKITQCVGHDPLVDQKTTFGRSREVYV